MQQIARLIIKYQRQHKRFLSPTKQTLVLAYKRGHSAPIGPSVPNSLLLEHKPAALSHSFCSYSALAKGRGRGGRKGNNIMGHLLLHTAWELNFLGVQLHSATTRDTQKGLSDSRATEVCSVPTLQRYASCLQGELVISYIMMINWVL